MGNRSAGYWILLVIAIGMAVAGFVVRSSPDPQKHAMAQYLGWGAIALLLIAKKDARLFPQKPAHVAFIDADNDDIRALERPPSREADIRI